VYFPVVQFSALFFFSFFLLPRRLCPFCLKMTLLPTGAHSNSNASESSPLQWFSVSSALATLVPSFSSPDQRYSYFVSPSSISPIFFCNTSPFLFFFFFFFFIGLSHIHSCPADETSRRPPPGLSFSTVFRRLPMRLSVCLVKLGEVGIFSLYGFESSFFSFPLNRLFVRAKFFLFSFVVIPGRHLKHSLLLIH